MDRKIKNMRQQIIDFANHAVNPNDKDYIRDRKLYSHQKVLLQTTNIVYDVSDKKTIFTGLNDATEYYIRATGITIHGMTLDTGYIHILVAYKKNT